MEFPHRDWTDGTGRLETPDASKGSGPFGDCPAVDLEASTWTRSQGPRALQSFRPPMADRQFGDDSDDLFWCYLVFTNMKIYENYIKL